MSTCIQEQQIGRTYRKCDDHDETQEAVREYCPEHSRRHSTLGITSLFTHVYDTLEGCNRGHN